jgi:eukaryotic-like serine/threonine-protein kinase
VDVRTQPSPTSTPHLDRDLAPPTRFGRYVFAGEIGTGGMGVVYAAYDPELDRMVAVKLLRDGDVRLQQRLRREAQVMARLAHPNVVAIHDAGTFEGRMFIAMEYVDGETLARWISRPHAQREILDVYCAAGRGLAAAHAAGIVHRDFKPDNVLIGHDGRVRVGDFGLACAAGARPRLPSLPALTAPGTLLGTRYYMAPELYKGVDADVRSDQFSFCVSLFAALYGDLPCSGVTPDAPASGARGSDARDASYRRTADDAARSSDGTRASCRLPAHPLGRRVGRRVRAALRRGLAVDPAARFSSIDELLAELAPSPRRPLPWLLALGATLAVLALGTGGPAPNTAACDPAPGATGLLGPERADVGKPNDAALLDPRPQPAAAAGDPRETCPDLRATVERPPGIVSR